MIYLKSYLISIIVLMFIICNNSYAEQKSCATRLFDSKFLLSCNKLVKECWVKAKDMPTIEVDKHIGIEREFIIFLKNQEVYDGKKMSVIVWCDNEQPKTCEDSFGNYNDHRDPSAIEFWELAKTITNIEQYNSVFQRYLEYLRKFPKPFKKKNDLLSVSDWCNKHENLCIESIRMEGFEIEIYSKPEIPKEVNSRNWTRAHKMREEDIPKSGFAADYIRFVRSTHRNNFDVFVTSWCFNGCTEYMSREGYNNETLLKSKKKSKHLPKNTTNKFYSCAQRFANYSSTSKKDYTPKLCNLCSSSSSANKDECNKVEAWCENECI